MLDCGASLSVERIPPNPGDENPFVEIESKFAFALAFEFVLVFDCEVFTSGASDGGGGGKFSIGTCGTMILLKCGKVGCSRMITADCNGYTASARALLLLVFTSLLLALVADDGITAITDDNFLSVPLVERSVL